MISRIVLIWSTDTLNRNKGKIRYQQDVDYPHYYFIFLFKCLRFFGFPMISLYPVPFILESLLIVSYFRNSLSLFLLLFCKLKKSIIAVFHRNPFSVRLFSIRRKWVSRRIVYSRRTNTPPFPPNQAIIALPSYRAEKKMKL